MNELNIVYIILIIIAAMAIAFILMSVNLRISIRLILKFWLAWNVACKKTVTLMAAKLTVIIISIGFFILTGGVGAAGIESINIIASLSIGSIVFGSLNNPATELKIGMGKGFFVYILSLVLIAMEVIAIILLPGLWNLIKN
ncbi:hypothetical protein [Plasticicumulans acidivorans]|uniref:hypothetical protein n=1 Tax=Plasticicumulans acidivorans TaxID=886464 RepID=UPI0011B54CF5|nr:hypothetical protein [Plasticicumulans acidivorans]